MTKTVNPTDRVTSEIGTDAAFVREFEEEILCLRPPTSILKIAEQNVEKLAYYSVYLEEQFGKDRLARMSEEELTNVIKRFVSGLFFYACACGYLAKEKK